MTKPRIGQMATHKTEERASQAVADVSYSGAWVRVVVRGAYSDSVSEWLPAEDYYYSEVPGAQD